MSPTQALLIGFGNPGRGDDGLGPALARKIEQRNLPGLSVDIDFQLSADHALAISKHQLVIFADADIACETHYQFTKLTGNAPQQLGSHSVTPEAAMALSKLLFQSEPQGYLLGIAGQHFGDMKEGLSHQAQANLDKAEDFLTSWYLKYRDPNAETMDAR